MRRAALVATFGVAILGFAGGVAFDQYAGGGRSLLRSRRVVYYVDPMHPTYRSDAPGTAPDCGMPLVPVYDEGGERDLPIASTADGSAVTIDDAKQRLVGLRVAEVERAARSETLRLTGRVVADERRVYRVNVGIDGYIRDVSAATTGSRVAKDQWLATVSAPDVRTAVQAFLVSLDIVDRSRKTGDSQAQIDIASAGVQQAADRLLTIGMSAPQLEDVRRTRLVPPNIRIASPADGFVIARNTSVGQKVGNGDELYRIADLRHVWVTADAFGRDVDAITPGAAATIVVPGRSGSIAARVSRDVPPQFEGASQTATIRLEVDNESALLRPDMFVDVDVAIARATAVVVPTDALVESGRTRTVYVERAAGVFAPRDVETGWRAGGRVEIVKGLMPRERIVVSGAFIVDAERRLRGGAMADRPRP